MANQKLLIATRNKGKFPEITAKLEDIGFEFMNLNDIDDDVIPTGYDVEEPAITFEGNAIIKAMTIGNMTGMLTLADDSGLEVFALDNRPGVLSARYSEGSDEDRYRKLLKEMKGVPNEKRGARFRCVIAIYDPVAGRIRTKVGACEGIIMNSPVGDGGFGFDPVFYCTEVNKAYSNMTIDEKNWVSHRGKALEKAKEVLKKEFLPSGFTTRV